MTLVKMVVTCRIEVARLRAASQPDHRGARSPALRCVWFRTGDPARPLACRWCGEVLNTATRNPVNEGVLWARIARPHL
jgi:hypothetical protein